MAKKPFITREFPVEIRGTPCYITISFEELTYLWNFAFLDEEDQMELGYQDIIDVLPQINETTGLNLKVSIERKRLSRKDFCDEYYVIANGNRILIGNESTEQEEHLQAATMSILATIIYYNDMLAIEHTENTDKKG